MNSTEHWPDAPDRIYLQVCDEPECGDTFAWHADQGVTWCQDKINDRDVAYVRADLALAQPTAEPPAPFGWVRVAESGKESLQPLFVLGPRPPPYPATYQPLYAAAPALLPAPADVRRALTDAEIAGCCDGIKPYPLELVQVPAGQVLAFARNVIRAALGATCPASHGDSDA